jgi:phage shock protein A
MPKPTYNNATIAPQNNEVISGNETNEIQPQEQQGGDLEARIAALEAKITELETKLGAAPVAQPGQEEGLEEARALFPSLNK